MWDREVGSGVGGQEGDEPPGAEDCPGGGIGAISAWCTGLRIEESGRFETDQRVGYTSVNQERKAQFTRDCEGRHKESDVAETQTLTFGHRAGHRKK